MNVFAQTLRKAVELWLYCNSIRKLFVFVKRAVYSAIVETCINFQILAVVV